MTDVVFRAATALVFGIALAGCGSGAPVPTDGQAQMQQEASTRVGNVVVRANAIPTAGLGEAVARQYGIERDAGTVMLLVGVRRDDGNGGETALPARVTAVAIDLLGKRQQLAMREVRSGDPGSSPGQGFIDYVGTARVIAPDTLRFDIAIAPQGGPAMELHFNRDFFPR
jgi:hypothetical protein